MRSVGIIGLGLIGGSMAKAIRSNTDCMIYGRDVSADVVKRALDEGVLNDTLDGNLDKIDLLLVALYPLDVVDIILEAAPKLSKGCIVIDCTGVKKIICDALSQKLYDMGLRFIGGHPMAGREVAGYINAGDDLFRGASMILCKDEYTDEDALSEAGDFFLKTGFGWIKVTTSEEHDRVIAYTSQLAHVVSSSYIKSPTLNNRYGFSAGSFKDMTRVAKLNEEMWADLFLANAGPLVCEIDEIMGHLGQYRDAIASSDRDRLVELLRNGRILKEDDEEKEK